MPSFAFLEFIRKWQLFSLLIELFTQIFGAGIWFFFAARLSRSELSSTCKEGWNKLDWVNFVIIMFRTLPAALVTAGCLFFCVCCCPCFVIAIRNALREERMQQEQNQVFSDASTSSVVGNLMGVLLHKKFDPQEFKEFAHCNECTICMCLFGEDDEVTPLPCSDKHYFHTHCIEKWLK